MFFCSPIQIYKFDPLDVFVPDAENKRISQNQSQLCWSDQQWAEKKKNKTRKHGVIKGLENLSKLPSPISM